MQLETLYSANVNDVAFVHDSDSNNPETLHIRHLTGNGPRDIKLSDEIKRLQLDGEGVELLVQRILQAMLEGRMSSEAKNLCGGSMWGSALVAARTYLPQDLIVLKQVLLATVIHHGGSAGYESNLITTILPASSTGSTMQDVVDYLVNSGCTEKEIRVAWAEMLRRRDENNFKTACIIDWWRGLKCGEKHLSLVAKPIARKRLLYELKNVLVEGCCDWNNLEHGGNGTASEEYMKLIDFLLSQTDYEWNTKNEEVRAIVEGYFIDCFARGKAGTAFYMFIRFGKSFGLWSIYSRPEFKPDQMANPSMKRLIRLALSRAEERHSFGVATALAEHLGEILQADHLRELARTLNQKVTLDFMFYHAAKQE